MFIIIEAAGGFVKNEKGKLLMIYRKGYWDLPKGKTEKGESVKDTALREVQEECGISNLKIIRQLDETYHIYQLHKTSILKKTFWFEMRCRNCNTLIPQKSEKIKKAKWMSKKDVLRVLPLAYPSVRELIPKNYGNYVKKRTDNVILNLFQDLFAKT